MPPLRQHVPGRAPRRRVPTRPISPPRAKARRIDGGSSAVPPRGRAPPWPALHLRRRGRAARRATLVVREARRAMDAVHSARRMRSRPRRARRPHPSHRPGSRPSRAARGSTAGHSRRPVPQRGPADLRRLRGLHRVRSAHRATYPLAYDGWRSTRTCSNAGSNAIARSIAPRAPAPIASDVTASTA